jgi:glucose/arabinose dehydrogenase
MKKLYIALGIIALLLVLGYFIKEKYSINPPIKFKDIPEDSLSLKAASLKIPEGFKVEIFARNIKDARSMCLSPSNTLFVGNRDGDKVYALRDEDNDNIAEKKYVIYKGGNMPNGVAFKDGALYVAEVNRILKFENIEDSLDKSPQPKVIYDKYPTNKWHGWKYIAFGPDGKLYVPVGVPCNICEEKDKVYGTMTRMNDDGTDMEIVHQGIRNTVGFTWHPDTKNLWFTDNGRDDFGDDRPNCELNHAIKDSMHFGFPYCHEGDIPDPKFGTNKNCNDYTKPVAKMGPHVAPLGLKFVRNSYFPDAFNNQFYIAKHGSWNRKEKIGYEIDRVKVDSLGNLIERSTFISGWLSDDKKDVWGRPVDIEIWKDGSLLISDDYANCIYRVVKI